MVARTQSFVKFETSVLIPKFKHYENSYYKYSLSYIITSNLTKFFLVSQNNLLNEWKCYSKTKNFE